MGFIYQCYPCTTFLQIIMIKAKQVHFLHCSNILTSLRDGRACEKNPSCRGCKAVFHLLIPHTIVASQPFMLYVILPKNLRPYHEKQKPLFPRKLFPNKCLNNYFEKAIVSPTHHWLRDTATECTCQ